MDVIINGPPNNFESFVKQNQARVIRVCYGLVHNMHDAEDIAQEVFLEAFRSLHKFRGDARVFTWLYRIAVNKSLNFIRDNKKRKQALSLDDDNWKEGINTQVEGAHLEMTNESTIHYDDMKDSIFREINKLPDKQRAAFVLCKYENLPQKQVADILNLTVPSVESLVHRAKKTLRKKLVNLMKN